VFCVAAFSHKQCYGNPHALFCFAVVQSDGNDKYDEAKDMKLQILSHAGMTLTSDSGSQVLCDPWLIGSTYWRSWWNYPPVEDDLVQSLKPDAIYLTHIHWDHFAGPSLRLFDPDTPIIIPKEPAGRMARDLRDMKLNNIIELAHGESYMVGDIKLTSYQFFVFLDSAVVLETDNQVVLNANDAKFMGGPLNQILNNHPHIDFVLRSHSSANSRICYEVTDDPLVEVDDRDQYIQNFAEFVQATGATHAIPFASNHCHLHKDVINYNKYAVSQQEVADYFKKHNITSPELHVMISGDYYDTKEGFVIPDNDWFSRRDEHIVEYEEAVKDKLEKTYQQEARATLKLKRAEKFFAKCFKAMPWFMRRMWKDDKVLFVLQADKEQYLEVDFYNKTVKEIESYTDESHPFQIIVKTALFNHCVITELFSHLAISKRVRYRMPKRLWKQARLLAYFFNFYEYDMLPLRVIKPGRFIYGWALRWREVLLYANIALNALFGRSFDYRRYLKIPEQPKAAKAS